MSVCNLILRAHYMSARFMRSATPLYSDRPGILVVLNTFTS